MCVCVWGEGGGEGREKTLRKLLRFDASLCEHRKEREKETEKIRKQSREEEAAPARFFQTQHTECERTLAVAR